MDLWAFFAFLLFVSVQINFFLVYKFRSIRKQRPLTKDAQELLKEITAGKAVLHISVIDPADIYLRSPSRG